MTCTREARCQIVFLGDEAAPRVLELDSIALNDRDAIVAPKAGHALAPYNLVAVSTDSDVDIFEDHCSAVPSKVPLWYVLIITESMLKLMNALIVQVGVTPPIMSRRIAEIHGELT